MSIRWLSDVHPMAIRCDLVGTGHNRNGIDDTKGICRLPSPSERKKKLLDHCFIFYVSRDTPTPQWRWITSAWVTGATTATRWEPRGMPMGFPGPCPSRTSPCACSTPCWSGCPVASCSSSPRSIFTSSKIPRNTKPLAETGWILQNWWVQSTSLLCVRVCVLICYQEFQHRSGYR